MFIGDDAVLNGLVRGQVVVFGLELAVEPVGEIAYARALALRNQTLLPWEVQQDRRSLSAWIDAQAKLTTATALDSLPSSKQVTFADRLVRIKRRAVPCRMSVSATRG